MAKKVIAPDAENVPARDGIVLNTISANCDAKNEIIVYQPSGGEFHIEVRVDDETVWLTQAQMAELFNATKQNVSLHISNIFEEGELLQNSTVKESLTVRKEGKREVTRKILLYNLDVIISVGYRVKSIQGTRFRQWATQILREHLLKGGSVNQRLISHENKLENLEKKKLLLLIRLPMIWLFR